MSRARQALTELLVPGWHRKEEEDPMKERSSAVSATRLFDTLEIYPGAFLLAS